MNNIEKLNIIFSRYIVLFGGEFGRCKSLSLTALTLLELLYTNKQKVISNMPLYYPMFNNVDIIPLIQTSQFDLKKLSEISNSIIIYDELHNDLNSRNFASEKNKFITNFSVGFRKDKIKFRGSLQFFDTLEKVMGLMLEFIIIPSFVKNYSDDSEMDRKLRLENKDFRIKWKCIDKKANTVFDLIINLYPFMKMYQTEFKPYPLVVNHEDYIEKLKKNKRGYYEDYLESSKRQLIENTKNWNNGLEKIRGKYDNKSNT